MLSLADGNPVIAEMQNVGAFVTHVKKLHDAI